jgi:hypothetical protein
MIVKSVVQLTSDEALDATAKQGSGELRQRVRRLAKQKLGEGPALCRLDALLSRSRRATERRNDLLHGLWAVDIDRGREMLRHDDGWRKTPESIELEQLADELFEIANELHIARFEGFLYQALRERTDGRQ